MSTRGYYPGSKKALPDEAPTPKVRRQVVTGWDERPVKKYANGKEVEFFTIGAVCVALGRPPVTIRLWIRQGHIPNAPYKMPDTNGLKGRRLYTREHIEALIKVALAHDLIDNPRVNWSRHKNFADDVRAAWADITT